MNKTFEGFKPVKGTEKALVLFKEIVKSEWFMLLCYGGVGCGKTHLCEALAGEVDCRIVSWPELVRNFKKEMHSEAKDAYDFLFDNIRKSEFLILDDVGMGGTGSKWEWGELEEIIDYRYRKELKTVVTTNLDLKQLPPRIVSRFSDAVTSRKVLNKAPDYRPMKGKGDVPDK